MTSDKVHPTIDELKYIIRKRLQSTRDKYHRASHAYRGGGTYELDFLTGYEAALRDVQIIIKNLERQR